MVYFCGIWCISVFTLTGVVMSQCSTTFLVIKMSLEIIISFLILSLGKNKHVTEGHLTLFVNTFPNFSQSISNIHVFSLWYTGSTYKLRNSEYYK